MLFIQGRVEGGLTGGADEVYADGWVMRAVHLGWTARENFEI